MLSLLDTGYVHGHFYAMAHPAPLRIAVQWTTCAIDLLHTGCEGEGADDTEGTHAPSNIGRHVPSRESHEWSMLSFKYKYSLKQNFELVVCCLLKLTIVSQGLLLL